MDCITKNDAKQVKTKDPAWGHLEIRPANVTAGQDSNVAWGFRGGHLYMGVSGSILTARMVSG